MNDTSARNAAGGGRPVAWAGHVPRHIPRRKMTPQEREHCDMLELPFIDVKGNGEINSWRPPGVTTAQDKPHAAYAVGTHYALLLIDHLRRHGGNADPAPLLASVAAAIAARGEKKWGGIETAFFYALGEYISRGEVTVGDYFDASYIRDHGQPDAAEGAATGHGKPDSRARAADQDAGALALIAEARRLDDAIPDATEAAEIAECRDATAPETAALQERERSLSERRDALIAEISATRARTPAGMVAKLRFADTFDEFIEEGSDPTNAKATPKLLVSVLRDLEAAASGGAPGAGEE